VRLGATVTPAGRPCGVSVAKTEAQQRNRAAHLVMTPVSFLARIAGLIPPPRFPLLRLSGVLGPNAPWRAAVVGYGRGGDAAAKATHDAPKRKRRKGKGNGKEKEGGNTAAILVDAGARRDAVHEVGDVSRKSSSRTSLGSGVVQAVGARIDWARLLRRVYLDPGAVRPIGFPWASPPGRVRASHRGEHS